uniref:Uncharacterized protein n=1 Tax=Psilocybe cubensis TaxID=181762 RepID=A0A8H7Y260_PSICU
MQIQEALKFIAMVSTDHFIGDIGQPLHVEAVALGGNQISVTCGGSKIVLLLLSDTPAGLGLGYYQQAPRRTVQQLGYNMGKRARFAVACASTDLLFPDASELTFVYIIAQTRLLPPSPPHIPAFMSSIPRTQTGEYNSLAASWLSCTSTTEPLIARRSGSIEDDIATILRRVDDDGDIEPLQCPIVWARDSNSFDCSFVFNFADKQDLCNSTYSVEAIPIIETQVAKQGLRLAAWLNVLFDGVPLTPSSGIPSPF